MFLMALPGFECNFAPSWIVGASGASTTGPGIIGGQRGRDDRANYSNWRSNCSASGWRKRTRLSPSAARADCAADESGAKGDIVSVAIFLTRETFQVPATKPSTRKVGRT